MSRDIFINSNPSPIMVTYRGQASQRWMLFKNGNFQKISYFVENNQKRPSLKYFIVQCCIWEWMIHLHKSKKENQIHINSFTSEENTWSVICLVRTITSRNICLKLLIMILFKNSSFFLVSLINYVFSFHLSGHLNTPHANWLRCKLNSNTCISQINILQFRNLFMLLEHRSVMKSWTSHSCVSKHK